MRNSSESVRVTTAASLTKAVPVTARVAAAVTAMICACKDWAVKQLHHGTCACAFTFTEITVQSCPESAARYGNSSGWREPEAFHVSASVRVFLRRVADVHVVALLIVAAC
jgi:hypothetical protein